VGIIRPSVKIKDKISEVWEDIDMDYPRWPANILLDDIWQEIVTDVGLDLDKGLYMYRIEEYPESHHTQ